MDMYFILMPIVLFVFVMVYILKGGDSEKK